jgi:proliferating cell nuclear antigen
MVLVHYHLAEMVHMTPTHFKFCVPCFKFCPNLKIDLKLKNIIKSILLYFTQQKEKMKLVISDLKKAKQFSSVFQALPNIANEVNLHFREDELYFQGMDMAHVCIFEMKIASDWFHEYKVETSKVIGINVKLVGKVLNCRAVNQHLAIVYDEKHPDVLEFQFENGTKDETNKYLTIPLYEFDTELLDLTMDDYQADIKMVANQFNSLVDQMVSFGELIVFECNEEFLELAGGDNSTGTIRVPIKIADLTEYMIEEGGHLKMSFAAKYIKSISMFSKVFKDIWLHVDTQKPMNFYYNFNEDVEGDTDTTMNYLKFYLAPKMTDDEEDAM